MASIDIRHIARHVPGVRDAGRAYRNWRWRRQAKQVFTDPGLLVRSLRVKEPGMATIETVDGLKVRFRRNKFDAFILKEVFLDREYLRRVTLPPRPVIVDIGGYIGDFSIYAAHYLEAKVIVYEPLPENFVILMENIRINDLGDRVVAHQAAVSNEATIRLNIQKKDDGEIHASAQAYEGEEVRIIPAVTPEQIIADNGLERIDLLKIDCEGGEYFIFPLLTPDFLDRVGCVIFEHHPVVPDWRERVERIFRQLRTAGFTLIEDGMVVSAVRRARG